MFIVKTNKNECSVIFGRHFPFSEKQVSKTSVFSLIHWGWSEIGLQKVEFGIPGPHARLRTLGE